MTVVDLVLQIALGVVFTAWVVRRDMRRLPPALYVRGWNEASFWSAIVAFGPLCIPVHFVRTRRTFVGFGLGLLWMGAVLVALSLLSEGLARVAEIFS